MFFASKNDRGPHVVLLQALLRLHGYNLTISGYWQQKTEEAVAHFRMTMGAQEKHGPVNPTVIAQLLQGKRIKLINAVDAEAGAAGVGTARSTKAAGGKPVMNERRVGHGVEDAMSRIRKRAEGHKIGALRFFGHGNRGTWISVALGDPVHALDEGRYQDYDAMAADWPSYIDYAHLEKMKPILKTLAPSFAPYGFVEAYSCRIGKQTRLLEGLADIWGVPVSGGVDNQPGGGQSKDQRGNIVPSTFSLTGEVNTAYPGNLTLEKWAARADQLIPNFPGMAEKVKNTIKGTVKG